MSDAIISRESSNDNHVDEAITLTFSAFELQAVVNALCEAVEVLGREATSAHAAPLAVEIEKARESVGLWIASSRASADRGRSNSIFGPVRDRVLSSPPAGKHRVQFSECLEDVTATVRQTPD